MPLHRILGSGAPARTRRPEFHWLAGTNGGGIVRQHRQPEDLPISAPVIRALDHRLRRDQLLQADLIAWLGRAFDELQRQGIALTYLARHLNRVADVLGAKIESLVQAARQRAFQATLALGNPIQQPRLDQRFEFHFPEENYPARWYYAGRYTFQKHFTGPRRAR